MVPVKLPTACYWQRKSQTTITDWGSTVLRVWSLQRSGLVPLKRDGFANRYAFDLNGLSILSLTGGNYHILNWLYVLLNNRKFRIGGAVAGKQAVY